MAKPQFGVVPAQPGFNYITTFIDENDRIMGIDRTPVIAWRITTQIQEAGRRHSAAITSRLFST